MAKIRLSIGVPALAGLLLAVAPASAHHPDRATHPVRPRIDVIPPLGNNLPPSYAARYNRPAYLTGLITYWIEPTSQEAMAWHRAVHQGYYANHAPRMETHYIYPKPWEVLAMGARAKPADAETAAATAGSEHEHEHDFEMIEAPPVIIEVVPELLPVPKINLK
jgi:hypothetical protein